VRGRPNISGHALDLGPVPSVGTADDAPANPAPEFAIEGIREHLFRDAGNRSRHCRGKEQRLALLPEHRCNPPHVVDEAHVEHAVRPIQDKDVGAFEGQRTAPAEVEKSSRGGHDDVRATREGTGLPADSDRDGEPMSNGHLLRAKAGP